MGKLHSFYPHAQLIECPEKWLYYTEDKDGVLILVESEHKRPGELGFHFNGLRSSFITKIETTQETIDSPIYVNIWTHEGEHFYKFKVWWDNVGMDTWNRLCHLFHYYNDRSHADAIEPFLVHRRQGA